MLIPANSKESLSEAESSQVAALFAAGRYPEVECRTRLLIEQYPDSGFAWKVLGASLQAQGKEALPVMQKAAELLGDDAEAFSNLCVAQINAGLVDEAIANCRRAIELRPDYAEAYNNLGGIYKEIGRLSDAAESFRRALAINPDFADALNNLGAVLKDGGHFDEAVVSLRRALELNPSSAEAHGNLGVALRDKGQFDVAISAFNEALRLAPDFADAHRNLGNVLLDKGEAESAVACYRRALEIDPNFAKAHSNLGGGLLALGRTEDAVGSYQRAIDLAPDFAEAHCNLGAALHALGKLDDAVASCRRAIELSPDYANAHNNLGAALTEIGCLDDAVASYRRAITIKTEFANAHSNLAGTLFVLGHQQDAVETYRRALQIEPGSIAVRSSIVCVHNYLPDQPPERLLAEARDYGNAVALQAHPYLNWTNARSASRRLRVGLVSGDLYSHPVSFFIEGVLAALVGNPSCLLDFVIYKSSTHSDEVTERIKSKCKEWHLVAGLSDESLAAQIRENAIDILIDLAGHTVHNRLPVFAWKPAPVQVSWLGYFATTGVAAIDYLIADPVTLPPSEECCFTEKIWRLPETRLCFTPPDVDIDVSALPALANGYITFGCFNNLAKVNDGVVGLWARVLQAVPGSRLIVKSKQLTHAGARQRLVSRFIAKGIDSDRLILEGVSPRADYLADYWRVDIAVDTFPFPGGTITAESLWMGVPVLTLNGRSFLSRQGVGLLTNTALVDWIAADEDDYVARAVAHASDLDALAVLRRGLRQQVLASPVFDAPRFAHHFEDALRGMWTTWCETQPVMMQIETIAESESDQLISMYTAGKYSDVERQASLLVERHPESGFAFGVLGASLRAQGKDALPMLHRAAELLPDDAEAHNNLGVALLDGLQWGAAVESCRRALEIEPEFAEGHYNLGSAHQGLGQLDDAVASFRRALEINPDLAKGHCNLGVALQDLGQLDDAVASYRRALEIAPDLADAWNNLGGALQLLGRMDEAVVAHRRALELRPDSINAFLKLALAQSENWQLDSALATLRQALKIKSDSTIVLSGLLSTQSYLPTQNAAMLFAEARRFGDLVARQAEPDTTFVNSREPERCLRVGIVSPDFHNHPVGYFIEGLLATLRVVVQGRLELIAYSVSPHSDAVTERIKISCDAFHSVAKHSSEDLARQIRDDGIDVLIDLAGHMGGSRLPMFARKPAPVQIGWLGYLGTTGVAAIDYLIADSWVLPESEEVNFTETIYRLPSSYLCFTPPDVDIQVNALRAISNGYVTFGSFNNLVKINDGVIALWARVLVGVPDSRLYLKAKQFKDTSIRKRIVERFAQHGVDAWRLVLEGTSPGRAEHFEHYHRVDIALDPFPFPGITTTLESLWMGVPVLTLAGQSFLSRQGVGLMMNAGLPDWIAADADDYVARAVAHASDLTSLAILRSKLRQQVLASPLFDAPRFAREFEAALRGMWRTWCAESSGAVQRKIESEPSRTFLHVGCGPKHKDRTTSGFNTAEWTELRLDIDDTTEPDIVGTMLDMSAVADGAVDAVFSSHNIEHLYAHEVPVALAEFRRVLNADGFIVITCPDLRSVCQLIAEDKLTDPAYESPAGPIAPLDILYGLRSALTAGNLYMAHRCGFTEKVLIATLQEAGFASIAAGSRAHPCYDLWAVATKNPRSEEEISALANAHFPG